MSRNSRSGMGRQGGDYGRMRGYDGPGGGYRSRGGGQGLLDGGYGGGGGYEMDGLLQQQTLQHQLSLRESQLTLANSLLQQQQSYLMEAPAMGMMGPGALGPGPAPGPMGPLETRNLLMHKRRMDMRPGDFGPDFKRPRNDFSPRPRDRYRSRDSDEGNRSSHSRRGQNSSRHTGRSRSSGDKYNPENPTDDSEKKGEGKEDAPFHCHVCSVNCRNAEGFRRHMNSMRHNDRMAGMLALHEEKATQLMSRIKAEKHLRHVEDDDKATRGYCKICDMALKVRYAEHQALTFHRKRVKQVTKGCGWCSVGSFKNFTEVLAHRETPQHKQNQEKHEDDEGKKKESEGSRKRAPIRVEIPADLARYNEDTAYGQMCVVPVTGWFCKLCNKFFSSETSARDTHCKAEDHYVKYKRFVYTKLRAKAEEERVKEEEDEKKKAEEEGKKSEEGEGQEDKDNGVGEEGGEEEEEMDEEEEENILGEEGMAGEYLEEDDMEEGHLQVSQH
ncbi:hypothetical protein ACOMHN_040710 [Nucella lapillus]